MIKIIAKNKKAFHEYHIDQKLEAGIVLKGYEVKSIRGGKVNLRDSYARIRDAEVFVHNLHISAYKHATHQTPDPLRTRKLLLNKREIKKLIGKTKEKGYSLIPLKVYLNERGKVKVEIGLARGKKLYDKRAAIKKKDRDRDLERALKNY